MSNTAPRWRFAVVLLVVGVASLLLYRSLVANAPHPWTSRALTADQALALFAEADGELFGLTVDEARTMRAESAKASAQARAHGQFASGKAFLRRGALDESIEVLGVLIEDLKRSPKPQAQEMRREAEELWIGAQMRAAELANCLNNHNADSCLLPIQGGGVHVDRGPMEAARASLEGLLEEDPEDLVSRWLLNLAAMTLDEWPAGVPERWRLDPALFAAEADLARFLDVAPAAGVAVDRLSGSPILEDFDGDGLLDIVTSSMGLEDPLRLFLNDGQGGFVDRTEAAGLGSIYGGLNCNQADYDNDGDVDILVLRGGWMGNEGDAPNSLLRNDGDATFTDVTREAGLLTFHGTQTASWADLDLDGDLDLFVGNESTVGTDYGHPCELWVNQGDGTFQDAVQGSGLDLHAFAKGATWGDYDEDGDPDLFVSRRDGPSRLYRNDSPGAGAPRFVDVTAEAGIEVDRRDFPCWFFDYDNDGRLDLFVGGYDSGFSGDEESPIEVIPRVRMGLPVDPAGYPQLWRNRGDGTFEDVAAEVGLHRVVLLMGANHGDLDGDGWQDLYLGTGHPDFRALMANRAFRNDGGERFLDVTAAVGMGHLQKGHGIAFGDLDGDGDQDVYATMGGWFPSDNFPNALYRNPGHGNRWITLRLRGRSSNRFGVGARITLRVATPGGERTIHHLVGSGGSFGSSSLQAEIGLGDATEILDCVVRWPGPALQRVQGLELDGIWTVPEGAQAERFAPPASFELRDEGGHDHQGG